MKVFGAVALLVLAAIPAIPNVQAQGTGLTLVCPDLAAPIPYAGQAGLACEVRVGCLEFITSSMGEASGTVTVVSPPAWLTSAPVAVEFAPEQCIAGGMASESIVVPLAVSADAPGVVDHALELEAAVGSTTAADTAIVTVAYHINYTLVADATFPLAVNGTQASFNVTVTQASNARSMVMMEPPKVTSGLLSGPASMPYENDAGKPANKTLLFTYRPPATEWTNATATFTAYSHYLLQDGRAGEFNTPACTALGFPACDATGTTLTFTFVNGAEPEGGGDKGAPGPVAPLVALGLVALAALIRRRP